MKIFNYNKSLPAGVELLGQVLAIGVVLDFFRTYVVIIAIFTVDTSSTRLMLLSRAYVS